MITWWGDGQLYSGGNIDGGFYFLDQAFKVNLTKNPSMETRRVTSIRMITEWLLIFLITIALIFICVKSLKVFVKRYQAHRSAWSYQVIQYLMHSGHYLLPIIFSVLSMFEVVIIIYKCVWFLIFFLKTYIPTYPPWKVWSEVHKRKK